MDNLLTNLLAAVLWSLLGIAIFVGAFVLVDRLTPGTMWKELIEDQNTAVAIVMGAIAIALAIIIAAAVH
jgi:putative membrane protein